MLLIVGLGNPGAKYRNTYHNVGYMIADALAKKLNVRFAKQECDARTAKGAHKGNAFVIAKPETYMNLSGESVRKLVRAYNIDERSELIVCYDDADLPTGKTRLRAEGSAGTHNGMRSIVGELNTTEFMRLRVGIKTADLAQKQVELIDLVLSKVDFEDKQLINEAINNAVEALISLIDGVDIQRVEEKLNRKK